MLTNLPISYLNTCPSVFCQVFKFEPGHREPSLTLGKLFEPAKSNEDLERFCQPTDVVVASNDDFFISDGSEKLLDQLPFNIKAVVDSPVAAARNCQTAIASGKQYASNAILRLASCHKR